MPEVDDITVLKDHALELHEIAPGAIIILIIFVVIWAHWKFIVRPILDYMDDHKDD